MDYRILFSEANDNISERYELMIDRIKTFADEGEASSVAPEFYDYFKRTADFILMIDEWKRFVADGRLDSEDIETLSSWNKKLYNDILPDAYGTSYANPAYAVSRLGDQYGPLLSFLYTEISSKVLFSISFKSLL